MEITINQNENQLISISNNNLQDININESENQLINISNSNTQELEINQPQTQTILIDGGGAVIGITDVLVNGISVVSGNIAYVIVPTKTSQLTNDSHFITSETDPTVPTVVKQITLADINNWNSKQNALVSGSTIKTVNNESLLGSGNINIEGTIYTAGDGISIENNIITNEITNYNDLTDLPDIPTKTSDLLNDSEFVTEDDLSEVAFTGSYSSLSDTPIIPDSTSELTNDSGYITNSVNNLTNYMLTTDINTALGNKQDTLVSGTNIKTINNTSILGSGNINTNIYSNNEIAIGIWTDGSTLYRKVISFTFDTANQWNNVNHNISGINEIINFKTIMKYLSNGYYYEVPNDIVLETRLNSTDYGYYFTNVGMENNATAIVIIEYTKNS